MHWKYRIAAVAGAVGVGLGTLFLTASGAHAQTALDLTTRQTNLEWVVGGQPTLQPPQQPLSPGDRLYIRLDVLQGGVVTGFGNVECTTIFNANTMCTAILGIANRGDLVLTGLFRGAAGQNRPQVFDDVVTGGTFAYRNAHGDAHAVVVNRTDTNLTLNLVTS